MKSSTKKNERARLIQQKYIYPYPWELCYQQYETSTTSRFRTQQQQSKYKRTEIDEACHKLLKSVI